MLVSPKILEHLRCSICQNFLSATPVKVYFNRTVKCARCVKENDGGVVSLYTTVSQYLRYPCKNYLEGCKEALAAFEVIDHEETCHYGSTEYECPFCEAGDASYNADRLSVHIRKIHSKVILNCPVFHINASYDKQVKYVL